MAGRLRFVLVDLRPFSFLPLHRENGKCFGDDRVFHSTATAEQNGFRLSTCQHYCRENNEFHLEHSVVGVFIEVSRELRSVPHICNSVVDKGES